MSNVFCLKSCLTSRVSRPLAAVGLTLCLFSVRAEDWGFAYSGQILETINGVKAPALVDGQSNYTAKVHIRLYDESQGGDLAKTNALWGRTITVNVRNSMFSCELTDAVGTVIRKAKYEKLQDAFANLTGDKLTVGVTPFDDENAEISPRQVFASVPFAVNAGDALGTVGDVTVGGTLTVGAARVPTAVFEGPVTHEKEATFLTTPVLRELTLGDSASLKANALVAGTGVDVATAEADDLKTGELTATVKEISSAAFANLKVSGAVEADAFKAVDSQLTVAGDVSARTVSATDLVLGGTFDFFKWTSGFETLPQDSSGKEKTMWHGNAGNGEWTVVTGENGDDGGDLFVAVNFRVTGAVTVKVDGVEVARLNANGNFGKDGVWLPFQGFLLRGQNISWSGSATELRFRYREFTY